MTTNNELAPIILALYREEKVLRDELFEDLWVWPDDLDQLIKCQEKIYDEFSEIYRNWGWPSSNLVGHEAAQAAAELVRNCFTQPYFMRQSLPYIEQAYRFGEIPPEWFAKLYDTIMYFEGKPQVYGTYIEWTAKSVLEPWKIVDKRNVDRRRRALQMESLDSYLKKSRIKFKKVKKKSPASHRLFKKSLLTFAKTAGWNRL